MVEAFSKNHAVSVWSEADPPRGNDKPSRYETVILPRAVRRHLVDDAYVRAMAAYVRTMGVSNLILQCRAVLQSIHKLHLGGFQRLRGIPAVERT